jgi:hypothetical protein
MDGTPYPPPAPQVPPTPAPPQPQYAPPPPQPAYDPQQYQQPQYQQPQPPKKKKTGLIIGIVLGVLLLCCVGSSVAAYLIYRAAEQEVTSTIESNDFNMDTFDTDTNTDISASTIDTGWESFYPGATPDNGYGALESFHQEVLDEVAASLFPDLVIEEALARPSTEYTTDTVVARTTLADNPDVQIAFYLEVENTAAYDAGWTNDTANEEYDYLDWGTASNGREYFWDNTQLVPLMYGITDPTVSDLLAQAAADFPGGVIYWVEVDGSSGYIEVTRWQAYADYSAGYMAYYTLDGDTWVLDSAEQW